MAPQVNLRNPLETGNEAPKAENLADFYTQGRRHQKSVTGESVPPPFPNKSIQERFCVAMFLVTSYLLCTKRRPDANHCSQCPTVERILQSKTAENTN